MIFFFLFWSRLRGRVPPNLVFGDRRLGVFRKSGMAILVLPQMRLGIEERSDSDGHQQVWALVASPL